MRRLPTYRRYLALAAIVAVLVVAFGLGLAVGEEKPEDHDAQWQWLHGREYVLDAERCDSCHEDLDCKTCHLAEYPHPDDWQDVHGPSAVEGDYRGCSLCHRSGYCDPCHGGVAMPHPDGFTIDHTRGRADDSACWTCHVEQDCKACHDTHEGHNLGDVRIP